MREAFVDLQELEAQTIMENPEKLRYSTGTYIHTSMLGLLRCFSAMNMAENTSSAPSHGQGYSHETATVSTGY